MKSDVSVCPRNVLVGYNICSGVCLVGCTPYSRVPEPQTCFFVALGYVPGCYSGMYPGYTRACTRVIFWYVPKQYSGVYPGNTQVRVGVILWYILG